MGKIPSNQWFNLIGHNGLCVDAARNGHRLRRGRCSTGSNSQWSFIPHNNGYIIRNKNNIAVDNSGSRNKDRNPIIGYKNHRGHNQIWVPEMVNGNTIRMRNPATNKCMETKGRLFYINTCKKSNTNQMFNIGYPHNAPTTPTTKPTIPTTPTTKPTTPTNKPYIPSIYVPTTNPNPSKGKPNVKIPSNQWVNLIGHNGLCVDAARNGHRLRQGRCSTGSNSQWSFIPHNNGYIIRTKIILLSIILDQEIKIEIQSSVIRIIEVIIKFGYQKWLMVILSNEKPSN